MQLFGAGVSSPQVFRGVRNRRIDRNEAFVERRCNGWARAKTAELDYLGEFFRKTAVRYVLMAEDLER